MAPVVDERLVLPRWLKWLAGVFAVFIAAAIAFAVFEPIQVLPRMRLAPGFAMVDQNGELLSNETVRGDVVLYGFTGVDCGAECAAVDETMSLVAERVRDEVDLGDVDFRLVSVIVDGGSDPGDAAARAASTGSAVPDGVEWTRASAQPETLSIVMGSGFQRYFDATDPDAVDFDAGFVIVDGNGIVRGDYRYSTLADDADKLVRHLAILGGELRHGGGAAGAAYEFAHLFLCYP